MGLYWLLAVWSKMYQDAAGEDEFYNVVWLANLRLHEYIPGARLTKT